MKFCCKQMTLIITGIALVAVAWCWLGSSSNGSQPESAGTEIRITEPVNGGSARTQGDVKNTDNEAEIRIIDFEEAARRGKKKPKSSES